MSVKRYDLVATAYGDADMQESDDGDYVDYDDYAALEAAEPKWIPYKEGDDVIGGGHFLIQYDDQYISVAHFHNGKFVPHNVVRNVPPIAYMKRPAPFVPEVSE